MLARLIQNVEYHGFLCFTEQTCVVDARLMKNGEYLIFLLKFVDGWKLDNFNREL